MKFWPKTCSQKEVNDMLVLTTTTTLVCSMVSYAGNFYVSPGRLHMLCWMLPLVLVEDFLCLSSAFLCLSSAFLFVCFVSFSG